MDQEQNLRQRSFTRTQAPGWRPTRSQVLWSIRLAVGLLILTIVVAVVVAAIVGYATKSSELTTITAAFIGLFGVLTTQVISATVAWRNAEGDRERQLQLAEQNAQDDWLQAYLDRMLDLMVDIQLDLSMPRRPQGNKSSDASSPEAIRSRASRTVARAQTTAVLVRMDGARKSIILRYLYETGVIGKTDLEDDPAGFLAGADLSGCYLTRMTLSRADLRNTLLRHADLTGVNLREADLREANLVWADLREADLRDANVRDAVGITNEELEQQAFSLIGATMPDGQKYEDWLKSKENGKNE